MASFRNVSADARRITYGLPVPRWVEPTAAVEIPDAVADAYDQPGIWERVAAPAPKTARKSAAADADHEEE